MNKTLILALILVIILNQVSCVAEKGKEQQKSQMRKIKNPQLSVMPSSDMSKLFPNNVEKHYIPMESQSQPQGLASSPIGQQNLVETSATFKIPITKKHQSREAIIAMVNHLSKNQAILLEKDSYIEIKQDQTSSDNKLTSTMVLLEGTQQSSLETVEQQISFGEEFFVQQQEEENQFDDEDEAEEEDTELLQTDEQRITAKTFSKSHAKLKNNSKAKTHSKAHSKSHAKAHAHAHAHAQSKSHSQSQKCEGKNCNFNDQKVVSNLPLINHHNTYFTGKVALGDQNETFDVIFDTGSSLTFINSEFCDDVGCKNNSQYNNQKSESYEALDGGVSVEFGSGTVEGFLARQTFYVNCMEIKRTLFIEITQMDGDVFEIGQFDGIVGLSFPNLAGGMPTMFDFMIKQNLVKENMFSFYLNRDAGSEESELLFGGYNENLTEEDVNWHSVAEEMYWSVNCQQILVGQDDTGICTGDKPCKLVIDSGTSLFTGPTRDLKTLLSKLDNGQGCKQLQDLPPITFVIDNVKYPIFPEEYVLTITNNGIEEPHTHSDMSEVVSCIGAFYALDMAAPAGPLWIMGDIFMSKYYSIFDRGDRDRQSRIGLALAKGMSRKHA